MRSPAAEPRRPPQRAHCSISTLKCGRLEHGFLRVRCEDCHAEKLVAFGAEDDARDIVAHLAQSL